MASTQCYLGASTPFGTIIHITDRVYNAEATVETKNGSTKTYRLPWLIAHGVTLAAHAQEEVQIKHGESTAERTV